MSSRSAAGAGAPLSTNPAEPHAALSTSGPAAGEAAGPSAPPAQVEQLRQQIAYALQGQSELRDLLGQCAESNAWTIEEAMQRPDNITTLELFLLQVPRLPLMHFFPNLVTVKLMSIGLESMATFASLTLVEELWLSDNNIRVIEGLDNMTRLRRLYLQGNRIESLQGLPPLRHLRELWLCRNHISVLTHLTPLRKLRSLYISSNPIESLEGAFSRDMSHLHDVNLSGCYITSITELRHLQQLTCLRHLWLLDPLFGDNPVCRLNNYVTLTLALLGSLDSLDGAYVTPEQRALVESVLHKKKSYYAMRAQMLDAQLLLLARHAESLALRHTQKSGVALRQLQACLQPIQHELAERSLYGLGEGKAVARAASAAAPTTAAAAASAGASTAASGGSLTRLMAGATESDNPTAMRDGALPPPPATSTLEELARTLSRAVGTREVQERTTLLRLAEATHAAAEQARLLKERFAVELHTAGNVRLENLAPDHEAYVAAADLVRERFDRSLFEERFGIAGVEVTSVRRIVNRGLRLRFDDRVKELHVDLANPQLRSRFVGLFGIVPAMAQGQSTFLQHTLLSGTAARPAGLGAAAGAGGEDGRRAAAAAVAAAEALAFQPVPLEEGVPLTNSLFYADEARLLAGDGGLATAAPTRATSASTASRGLDASTALSQRSNSFGLRSAGGGGGGAGEAGGLYRGQVVLYRVYLGKTVHALGGAAGSAALPPNSFLHTSGRVWRRDYGPDTCAAYRLLPTSPSGPATAGAAGPGDGATPPPLPTSYMWYCFDRALLLPDCVVDYAYTLRSDSPPAASPLTNSSTPSPTSPRGASLCMSRAAAEALLTGSVLSPTSSSDACGAALSDGDASSPSLPPRARQRASDVVEDVLRCGESLLQFMHWCSSGSSSSGGGGAERPRGGFGAVAAAHGNTLQQVADAETKEALAQVARGLGAAQTARLLGRTDAAAAGGPAGSGSPDSNSDGRRASTSSSGGSANPLQARHIEAYAAQMQVAEGQPLPLCVLRSRGLTAVLQDFGAPRCATITTLDLAHNRIAAVSWFALAKEAPQLQRLNLSSNALSRLHLDGSSLPALRELDVSGNDLVNVCDFALIRTAAPVLEELVVHGNPFLQTADGQEAAARLWFYLLPPTASAMSAATSCSPVIVKVNSHSLGAFPGTLAAQRFRRACLLPGGRPTARMTGVTTLLVQAVQREEERGGGPAAAAVFSVDGVTMPEYCFEQAAARLEQLEAAGDVEAVLRDSLGASHGDGGGAVAGLQDCQSFRWSRGLMGDARGLAGLMPNLCHLTLRGQALTDVAPLLHLRRLVRLNLAENHLSSLPCLAELKALTELVLDFNHLTSLPASVGPLPALRTLSAAGNQIESVDIGLFAEPGTGRDGTSIPSTPPPAAPQLEALFLMHNYIADMNVIYALRDIPSLLILSVLGNPCTVVAAAAAQEEQDSVRPYLIHVFPQLKVLDGVPISPGEAAKAREEYAGKINSDLLIERTRCQPETWASVQTLNLSHCSLKEVNLLEPFVALEVLQLQHNLLVNVAGVATLTRLTALDLSHNRLGALPWRSSTSVATSNGNGTARNGGANAGASAASAQASASFSPAPYTLGDVLAPLKRLQSLSLEANQISDLSTLKLRLPHLKFLNVRGNELQFIQRGLENLPELRELLLDQNKLRSLSPDAFAANRKLSILSAENNALRSVEGLQRCAALEQVRLAANRLGELNALLHDLEGCPLRLAVFLGNPIARKTNYRPTVILRFSTLAELDRRAVTADEREKAATARMTELVAPPNVVFDMSYLPIGGSAAVSSPGQPALTSGVAGGGAVGGGGNGAAPLPSRTRVNGGGAPIAATMVTLTPPQQPLAGVRAPLVANKRGVASDRFAVNARSRQYRR